MKPDAARSRSPRPRLRPLLPALALLLLAPALAHAQRPATAVLEIVVLDGATAEPLAGAQVRVPGSGTLRTDPEGRARFEGLAPVGVEVEVRALGYQTRALVMDLVPGRAFSLSIPVEALAVILPEVRVEAQGELAARSRELKQFYRRVRTGAGQYITREEISRRRPRDLADLFQALPGIGLLHTEAGEKPFMEAKTSVNATIGEQTGGCPIQYFLDGAPIQPIHGGVLGSEVELSEIEGIEIYRRGSGVPAKFQRLNNSCGVILIWKKERI